MGQSLVKNYVHIVFSTKHRQPMIERRSEDELFAHMTGTCNELGCHVIQASGFKDHVHILCMLRSKLP